MTKLRRKKDAKTITRPMIAAMIVFRADSTAALSPPEKIHLSPPQIRKMRATITAITKRITMIPKITLEMEPVP